MYNLTQSGCVSERDDNLELEMLNLLAGHGSRVSGANINISWCPLFLTPTPSNSFLPVLLSICLKLEGRFSCKCHKTLYTEGGPHRRCVRSNSKVAYSQILPSIGSSQNMTLNTSPSREKKNRKTSSQVPTLETASSRRSLCQGLLLPLPAEVGISLSHLPG